MAPTGGPRGSALLWTLAERLRRGRRKSLHTLLAGFALLLVVTGCSTGNVDDARRFQAQEAELTPVLPQVQATELAERFKAATPEPPATFTPSAMLSRLVLSRNPGGGGSAANELQSIPAYSSGTIYASAQITDLQTGQIVSAVWSTENGDVIAQQEHTASGAASQWIDFPLQLSGNLPPGNYAVAIGVDGVHLESLAFRVT